MSGYFHQDFLRVPDGADLYYRVQGDGAPGMVLCDGLGCDGFAWKYLAPFLERSHRTVRWHYRGHGQSTVPEDRERIGMLYTCDDLERVMDAAGLERAVLFGHSMGVQVALEFHRRHSERVAGLVLVCGSYGTPLDTFHDSTVLKRAFPYVRRVVERFPRGAARVVHAAMRTELAVEIALALELNRELIQRNDLAPYFEHLARMDPVVFVRTLDSLSTHSCWDHLPYVDVPTLVVAGELDKFTPCRLSKKMAEAIPGADFVVVPGGTHTAPLENPGLVETAVGDFLRTRVLRAALPSPQAPGPARATPPAPAPEVAPARPAAGQAKPRRRRGPAVAPGEAPGAAAGPAPAPKAPGARKTASGARKAASKRAAAGKAAPERAAAVRKRKPTRREG